MKDYRGLVTNLATILAITVCALNGVTTESVYLALVGVAGAHAARAAYTGKPAAVTGPA